MYQCLPDKSLHLKGEKCIGGKHSKVHLTRLAALLEMPMGKDYLYSILGSLKTQGALKALKIRHAVIDLSQKVGCPRSCLRNGLGRSIEIWCRKKEDCFNCRQWYSPPPMWESLSGLNLSFSLQTPPQLRNPWIKASFAL